MTHFDYIFIAVMFLSGILGIWRGLVSEIIGLVSWIVAIAVAWMNNTRVSPYLADYIQSDLWRDIVAFFLVFVLVLILVALLRVFLRQLLQAAGLSATDRFLGFIFGLVRGLILVIFLVLLGGFLGVSQENWWVQAKFSPILESTALQLKPWLPEFVVNRLHFVKR